MKDEGSKIHVHTFATEWTYDGAYHWKAATCEHTTEISGNAAHSFGEWTTTKEATEEEVGSKERVCSVCYYKETAEIAQLAHTHKYATEWESDATNHWHKSTCGHEEEVSEKAAHSFGEWTTTKEATEEEVGSKERVCSVCNYKETVEIEKLAHIHKFATEWTYDGAHHWKAATCEHTSEVSEKAKHTFDGIACTECDYEIEGFVYVKGTTITGTETWTPSSEVFVSGRQLTIPDLYVSDHEVTRGEYKEVMGSDPSTASAYDKDGNELTGDAVLNNPVNRISWYDALVYCNKLSIKENLTPCYTINGSTDPDKWGTVPTSSDSTWDAATCNFEVNGYRLPTEAEWEWLARGGEEYTYAGSDTVGDVAWYTNNTNDTGTREVKTKVTNGYGLYDMSGNVLEWCWDWYGSINESTAATGAASGSNRVFRGGSWYSVDGNCRVAIRGNYYPYFRDNYRCGLRVVRPSSRD